MTPIEASTQLLFRCNSSAVFEDKSPLRRVPEVVGPNVTASTNAKFGTRAYACSSAAVAGGVRLGTRNFGVGTGPFTLAAWVFIPARQTGARGVVCTGYSTFSRPSLFLLNDGRIRLQMTNQGNSTTDLNSSNVVALDTWTHIAGTRDAAGISRVFVGGVLGGSTSTVADMQGDSNPGTGSVYVGSQNGAFDSVLVGGIDEALILAGHALWDGDFTPPVAPYADCPSVSETVLLSSSFRLNSRVIMSATPRLAASPLPIRDELYGGQGRILGTVKKDDDPVDLPLRRRVRLFRERDGHLVRETWSNANSGAYVFENIDETVRYTVLAYDYERNYRAVVADNIQPEPMP